MSLGVDLIPHKVCSLNCIYCECGPTTSLTSERKAYVPVEEVFGELTDFFEHHPDPDYITFSGAGEPTLHSGIGEVIHFIKECRPAIPVAILTNGTLLIQPSVRAGLMEADLVMPSLDAATDSAFHKINRPSRDLNLDQYIEGLATFSREFHGEIWLEVLILPGYNDDRENLEALKRAIQRIGPGRVQLNTLDRPGAIEGLKPASRESLERIAELWGMENVEIIAPPKERQHTNSYRQDLENAILETLSRRPCTLEDLEKILALHVNEINKYLGVLEESGRIITFEQERGTFYKLSHQHHPFKRSS
jgi:wyosine [tRNA(Phe)-imidazoG37] synthetase (radical SAM superfamily)